MTLEFQINSGQILGEIHPMQYLGYAHTSKNYAFFYLLNSNWVSCILSINLTPRSTVTSGKRLFLSEPPCLHLWNGYNDIHLAG